MRRWRAHDGGRRAHHARALSAEHDDVERQLGADGRVLVRYSGTESKARVMIEGMNESQIKGWADEIAGMLAKACRA